MAADCRLLAPALPWLDQPQCTGSRGERRGTVATGNARQRDAAARPGHPGFRERNRMAGPDRAVRHARPARLRLAPPASAGWRSLRSSQGIYHGPLPRPRGDSHPVAQRPASRRYAIRIGHGSSGLRSRHGSSGLRGRHGCAGLRQRRPRGAVRSSSAFLRLSSQISRAVSVGTPAPARHRPQPDAATSAASPRSSPAATRSPDRRPLRVVVTGMITDQPDRFALTSLSYLTGIVPSSFPTKGVCQVFVR